ncbi:MAG: hypothetical protein EOP84_26035, partial [Verrucomicrobiaceae bacterium]
LVAQMLGAHSQPYLAVDADIDAVIAARRRGYEIMFGDIARPGMIEHLDLANASALILTMDDPVQLVRITRYAPGDNPQEDRLVQFLMEATADYTERTVIPLPWL